MNGIDLTKQNIKICDELICENGYINAVYELWFDVEKYFDINLDEDEWVDLYTNWYPNGDLEIMVQIERHDGFEYPIFEPDEKEKEFLISKMEEACKEQCEMSLIDFYDFCENEWN